MPAATATRKSRKTPLAKAARQLNRDQRDKLTDVAIDELYELYPTTSIDSLLTWPRKARTLCAAVAGKLNQ
jgi:adenine/guanine phosphoribosyltransferase-like PRPP-binding protein